MYSPEHGAASCVAEPLFGALWALASVRKIRRVQCRIAARRPAPTPTCPHMCARRLARRKAPVRRILPALVGACGIRTRATPGMGEGVRPGEGPTQALPRWSRFRSPAPHR